MEDPLNFREMFAESDTPEEPVEKKDRKGLYLLIAGAVLLAAILSSVRPVLAFLQDRREQQSIVKLKAISSQVIKQEVDNHAVNVDLSGADITPAILDDLKNLHKLKVLDLSGSKISNVGLSYLTELSELESLNLNNTEITDTGIAFMSGMKSLDQLLLRETKITDEGLKNLKGMSKMTMLDLSDTQITDEGLQSLRGLTRLNYLFLNGTPVTDQGLDALLDLYNLLKLELNETRVTFEGNRLFCFKTLKCQTQFNPKLRYDNRKKR